MIPTYPSDSSGPPVSAVVFDLDGTLVDSSAIKLNAYFAAVQEFAGGSHEEQARAYARHGTLNRTEQLYRAFTDVAGRAPRESEIDALTSAYTAFCQQHAATIRLLDGFEDLCRDLEGCRLAIASNAPQVEVVELCDALGVAGCFERIYGHPISKVQALLRMTADWELEPMEVLYVGDRPEDGAAADAAGTRFRLIDHTGRAPYGRDRLVRSFRELGQVVGRLGRGAAT